MSGNRTEYQNLDEAPSASECEGFPSADLESMSQASPAYRVVVVGRTGCGKSTICNALLNAKDDKFQVQQGMGSSSAQFQSEFNKEYKLYVVDTPDVFSMGYPTETAARHKFKELDTLKPSGITTAFLFPIRFEERFTQDHYNLCHKYLNLLPEPFKNNGILILTNVRQSEMTDDKMKESLMYKLLDIFNNRVIWLPKVPTQEDGKKKFIGGVIEHLRTMNKFSLEPRRGTICTRVYSRILAFFHFVWRQLIRAVRWLCGSVVNRVFPKCPWCHSRGCSTRGMIPDRSELKSVTCSHTPLVK